MIDLLPRSVSVVIGDVGEPAMVKAAVEGCNKIIYCATARSTITADLYRVDYQGVYNIIKAFQVCILFPKIFMYSSLAELICPSQPKTITREVVLESKACAMGP